MENIFQDTGEAYTNIFMTQIDHTLIHGRCWATVKYPLGGKAHMDQLHTQQEIHCYGMI